MMIIPERVEERRVARGITQAALARAVGVSQQAIGKIEGGGSAGSKHLHIIARELNTSPEYLTGESDDPAASGGFQSEKSEYRGNMPVVQSPEVSAEQLGSVLIPQLEIGYSMGGGSVFADYQQTAMVPFPREWLRPLIKGRFDELFVARGDGDSMMPTLLDGDLVIVDTAQKNITTQDRLWCLSYGDLGMIKRVRMLPDGGAQINSDNPNVTTITAYDGEMSVVGRVIWIGRRV